MTRSIKRMERLPVRIDRRATRIIDQAVIQYEDRHVLMLAMTSETDASGQPIVDEYIHATVGGRTVCKHVIRNRKGTIRQYVEYYARRAEII